MTSQADQTSPRASIPNSFPPSASKTSTTTANARPSSPIPPPVEPLSPYLGPQSTARTRTYTHNAQTPQVFIPQPAPQVIDFSTNSDAIALQAAISVLQVQRQNAMRDIVKLKEIKERAASDPEAFVAAFKRGELSGAKDNLFDPSFDSEVEDEDEEEEEEVGMAGKVNGAGGEEGKTQRKESDGTKPWPTIPTPQNIVQVPNINWAQYGIMGESLDRLHMDQVRHPTQGKPAVIKPDGTIVPAEGGPRGDGGPVARQMTMAELSANKERGRGGAFNK